MKIEKSKVTVASLLVALGIIYGDIGTSPLYAIKAVIGDREISTALVYGGVSCIFWTLIFQTTIKYIWLTLRADNHGEGGVFSLYSLVRRFGKKLVIPTILGATTLLADGIITPPISVASAVEGLSLVNGLQDIIVPGNTLTIGIVIVILSALFFMQHLGTDQIGRTFGPVMAIWFAMLLIVGFGNVMLHPEILQALHPKHAVHLLTAYPHGFWLLGAVFLCTTGAEALYSDLGHCGVRNIRLTWGFVKVSLLSSYLGQAAWLLHQGDSHLNGRNPFFEIVPDWFLLPSIIIATLATIIASQALISGSFTLINEAINLNFWPKVAVRQPTNMKGQIYIPSINIMLWIGCTLMILYFHESSHMEAAYGFSITVTMLMTSLLMCYYLRYRLHWKPLYVAVFALVFFSIELSFFIANVAKIKERWMFLFFELFIFMVMYVWYFSRKINNRFTGFVQLGQYSQKIKALVHDDEIPVFADYLVFLTKADKRDEIEEKVIRSIFSKNPKRALSYWFVHLNRTNEPYTLCYEVEELIAEKVYKINIDVGFRIQPRTELYFKKILQELEEHETIQLPPAGRAARKYGAAPDIKFVIFQKFLSVDNAFGVVEGILLQSYFRLKKWSLSDDKAFGIEQSDVVIEPVPLVLQACVEVELNKK